MRMVEEMVEQRPSAARHFFKTLNPSSKTKRLVQVTQYFQNAGVLKSPTILQIAFDSRND